MKLICVSVSLTSSTGVVMSCSSPVVTEAEPHHAAPSTFRQTVFVDE